MNERTKAIIALYPNLKDGVVVAPDVVSSGSARVEIRENGHLHWRAFDFEPGFYDDLEKNLKYVSK
ncbi:hypothetical protein K2895_004749 [Shigella sonnei]|uniref:hypothetical protein n=1 Tax=Escherichia coli TaxID=562 RepID=UPI0018243E16|nr:hypothetical protein [Escherichia coli]EDW6768799.1 hypothetical protein [Salmonella enterica subsp. enterica serovar Johannesburg]EFV9884941.1 hypothetical protein [Shigella sonnei]EKJ2622885.1 hypothetical protein [Shigella flexneri]HAC8093299.1 hypothetical protein [Salmonella enterica subsp. enterica serovar Enteritidis]HBN2915004.1 hypothetical protein [Escherichia coli O25b:H4-ST131]